MDDPSKFLNFQEYRIAYYAITLLIISEVAIMVLTSSGNKNRQRKAFDYGTMWLLIICWCYGVISGAFFRSQSIPSFMRNWLFPHISYDFGILLIIGGIILRCTAVLTLRRAFTFQVQTTDDQHLIKTGVYRFIRNPAYTGSMLSLLGVTLAYRSILATISVFVICLLCYGIRIHVEEKALKEHFQEEFEHYCQRTKYRLIPKVY